MAKDSDVRATPRAIISAIERDFDVVFDLDVCALAENRCIDNYFGPDQRHPILRDALFSGLRWSDHGTCMWLNPPYSEIAPWLAKAAETVRDDPRTRIVACLPASTSTKWWHRYIWNRFQKKYRPLVRQVQYWPKRIEFGPHKDGAKWPSVFVEFGA